MGTRTREKWGVGNVRKIKQDRGSGNKKERGRSRVKKGRVTRTM
jgi:hypothetical protein